MTTKTHSAARLLLGISVAGLTALAGCDREDAVSVTLAAVQHDLASAHSGGAAAAPPATRATIYSQAVTDLQGAARSGTEAQRDAANVLLAQAHSGMAQIESAEAIQIENRLLDRATRLRATLDLYASQSALSSALGSVDAAAERAALDQALTDVDQRLSDAQSARRDLQQEHDAYKTAAEGAAQQATTDRTEAAELRSRALDAPATEAAKLIERAYEIERIAAESEREAARQTAMMEKIAPRLQEAERLLGSLADERAKLTEARKRVDQRTQDARQQSQTARAAAIEAARDAEAALAEIEAIRTGELTERWNQALQHAQSAVTALSQSRGGDSAVRATNALLRGEAQQRLGEMHAARARGVERYLLLLDNIESVEPAVPFMSRVTDIINRAESELLDSGQAAADAFAQAASTYQSAGVRDQEVRDRLERLQQMLQQAAGQAPETPASAG